MAHIIERPLPGLTPTQLLQQKSRNDAATKTNQFSNTLVSPGSAIKENPNFKADTFILANASYPGFKLVETNWTVVQGLGQSQITEDVNLTGNSKFMNVWFAGQVNLASGSCTTFTDCKFAQTVNAEAGCKGTMVNCTFLPPSSDYYAFVDGKDPSVTPDFIIIGGSCYTTHVNVTTIGTLTL